ncbi:MAG: dipeptidase [Acidobacteriaceae bacterium]|nr:dipeptidase [Acidobacteriaceae bacterium]
MASSILVTVASGCSARCGNAVLYGEVFYLPRFAAGSPLYTDAKPMFTRALSIVSASLLLALPLVVSAQSPAKPSAKPSPKMTAKLTAEQVHNSAIVIDTHADTPQRILDENYDLADPLNGGNLNLESARKGNLGAEFFSIWVEPKANKGQYAHRTLALIDAVRQQAAKHPDRMVLVTTPEGIELAHRQHKLAALMGIEGGHSIENSLGLLRDYYALGVRYMTLTWSNSNDWADSSGDIDDKTTPHTKEGLTEFGKDVVYEMNRLGMMVDISHVSDRTFYRTLVISRAPVIASHSSARALCDAPRNMTDDMLRAVANNGGVVQVNFYSAFLSQAYKDAQKAQKPEVDKAVQALKDKYKSEGKEAPDAEVEKLERSFADRIPRPPLSLLIDHIDHIAKVAGVDHVGLGSDFDGVGGQLPQGIDSLADLPKITAALMERGYSAEDCRKILGGNLLRVFREVEQIAKQLQAEDRPRITDKQPFDKPQK